jgi:hypothetical protein
VAYWLVLLDESYTTACEEDCAAEWFKELLEHASHGHGLLVALRSMVGVVGELVCWQILVWVVETPGGQVRVVQENGRGAFRERK